MNEEPRKVGRKALYSAHTNEPPLNGEHPCPNGHGPLIRKDYYSCPTCHYWMFHEVSAGEERERLER